MKDFQKANSEFKSEVVCLKRVSKVVRGGRRFSFEVIVVVSDKKGYVGIGKGKAIEIPDATHKATQEAKRSLFKVPLKQERTIHHDVEARAGACKVIIRSAPAGTGVIAGGATRVILDLLGIQDVVAKSFGSGNVHNQINATVKVLKLLTSPKYISRRRMKPINEIISKREILTLGKIRAEKNGDREE
jgi:small subunit ribosomal protein S5